MKSKSSKFLCLFITLINLGISGAPDIVWAQPVSTETPQASFFDRLISKFRTPTNNPYTDQDHAAQLARDGKFDEALKILEPIYKSNTNNLTIARDYVAILSWDGRDQDAVTIYETLPAKEPDYVLSAVGHSYRKVNQPEKALAVYRLGLDSYPDSVIFAEGEIRCLADKQDYDSALSKANEDITKHGERGEIVTARQEINQNLLKIAQDKAVSAARAGQYQQGIDALGDLHTHHPEDLTVTRDYLSVLGWAGNHDDQVISLYEGLPPGDEPDFVLAAAAGSYRRLGKSDKALGIYQQGLSKYLDNVTFTEGIVRCLTDLKKYDDAIAVAREDFGIHGQRPEIVAALQDAERMKPKPKKHGRHKRSHPHHSKKT